MEESDCCRFVCDFFSEIPGKSEVARLPGGGFGLGFSHLLSDQFVPKKNDWSEKRVPSIGKQLYGRGCLFGLHTRACAPACVHVCARRLGVVILCVRVCGYVCLHKRVCIRHIPFYRLPKTSRLCPSPSKSSAGQGLTQPWRTSSCPSAACRVSTPRFFHWQFI